MRRVTGSTEGNSAALWSTANGKYINIKIENGNGYTRGFRKMPPNVRQQLNISSAYGISPSLPVVRKVTECSGSTTSLTLIKVYFRWQFVLRM